MYPAGHVGASLMWPCGSALLQAAVWFYFCSAEHFSAYSLTSVLVLLNKKGGSVQSYLPFHICGIRNLRPKVTRWKAQGSLVSHLTFFTYNVISFRNTMILLCSDSFRRPVQEWAQSMHDHIAKWSCNFSLVLGLRWSHVIKEHLTGLYLMLLLRSLLHHKNKKHYWILMNCLFECCEKWKLPPHLFLLF